MDLSGINLSTSFLLANLFWGSVGAGYFIYGKKQQSMMPMIGGVAMVAASFIGSALLMTAICVAIGIAVYVLAKQGH